MASKTLTRLLSLTFLWLLCGFNAAHGTTVVVVATKDGFVLAGDSRGSYANCEPAPGEFEKVFSMGNRGAIVVAGQIVSHDSTGELGEALATDLHMLDKAADPNVFLTASTIMWHVVESVRQEVGLLDPDTRLDQIVAEASSVAVDKSGTRALITVTLSPVVRTLIGGARRLDVKLKDFWLDPPTSKVRALGSGAAVVDHLTSLSKAADDVPYSQDPAMKRYYSLKENGRLSDLTLDDGKHLAELFVRAAIKYAETHPCSGIGGSIDVLTVTSAGTEWVHKKNELAPIPPAYHVRIEDSPLVGRLDGGEWFRATVPDNGTVVFNGDSDVKIVQPRFAGSCTFVLSSNAQRRMPATSDRLKAIFGKDCDIYLESNLGRVKLSSAKAAPPTTSQPPSSNYQNEYACMSDAELKRTTLELVTQIRGSVEDETSYERQVERPSWQPSNAESIQQWLALGLKGDLLKQDAFAEWASGYCADVLPKAVQLQQELIERTREDSSQHDSPLHKGDTSWSAYQVAGDLEALASKLSTSENRPHSCR